ncbi:sigma-70 family RNA polymerase sigma factor [Luteolibacter arcticus]|uniref:Sigma-70 family RNA polymerase sigma factor n=1 Tax=Luteolibacter arcticus TaxID=1581411 RepID=A0ABT3GEE3_9BACT|nr:sigma-70 family RNA polymerase sigma factor [Luteolibacter arcticus]MCW1921986.1 sigma-70 family RNA polymerase sigma factor [Luteolibacter arcticus]
MSSPGFHSTRWTLVRRAQGRGDEARVALSELCEIYYEPVVQFTRRWCADDHRAEDLAHGFFEDLLGRETLGAADPGKGRFRSYLLAAVKHFLSHQRQREAAAKRGGGVEMVAVDDAADCGISAEWEQEFDRAWALALIRRALEALGDEMEKSGKRLPFDTLRPWLDGGMQGDAAEAGLALGLSPAALKVAIHRLRQRFRQRVRDEIAATVEPAEVEGEFRHLVEVWVR